MCPDQEAIDADFGQGVIAYQEYFVAKSLEPLHGLGMNNGFFIVNKFSSQCFLELKD